MMRSGPFGPLWPLSKLSATEIDENAVAHILRNEATEGVDLMRDTTVIGADDLAEVLWIHLGGKLRRANQIAKQDRDLAALGGALGGDVGCLRRVGWRFAVDSARKPAMALSSLRRCPTILTPRSFKSSSVRLGRTVSSIAFSRMRKIRG
jgi:hypothetical protein